MTRALALISAGAGALVGLVKLVGLITGSEWLGDTWKVALGYVAAAAVAGAACVVLFPIFSWAWARGLGAVTAIREPIAKRHRSRADNATPRARKDPAADPRSEGWRAKLVGVALLGIAAWMAVDPESAWWVGVLVLGYALLFGGLYAWVRSKEIPRCPHCVETINAKALVCGHCGRDVTELSPEDDEPDLVWL